MPTSATATTSLPSENRSSRPAGLDAHTVQEWLTAPDGPRLLDVRSPAEFSTAHIPGSYNVPLALLREHRSELRDHVGEDVLVCRSGARATQAESLLGATGLDNLHVLNGGITAWEAAGGALTRGHQTWELERQVRLVAGTIVLSGILASTIVPAAKWLSAGVGAGLTFAALTDSCAMGMLLSRLPYNRRHEPDISTVIKALQRLTAAPPRSNKCPSRTPTDPDTERREPAGLFVFGSGAAIGLLGGMIGLGGAEFRPPLLSGVFGFAALQAIIMNKAMSLVVVLTALPARLLSVPFADVAPHWPIVVNLLVGSLVGAWLGATWATRLHSRSLYRVLAVLLVLIAAVLVVTHITQIHPTALDGWPQVVVGVFGVVAALMGVAGGELLIPAIVLIYAVDSKIAGSL